MNGAVLFCFHSNIEAYRVRIDDGCGSIVKRVSARRGHLCIYPRSPCVRVIAQPLTDGYSTLLYFSIDASCQNTISLYFNFPINQTPTTATYTFTLTDRNYGLPIDGSLQFTQT